MSAAEQTGAADRAKAIALVAAAFGVGAGLVAVVRGLAEETFGFRGVFALALIPLLAVIPASRRVAETDRFRAAEASEEKPLPVIGAVAPPHRSRLMVLVALTFAVAVITGPANSFIFVYAENVLGLSAGATATMVVAAAPAGLAGLLVGRWSADHVGRRGTGGVAMVLIGVAGMVTYSGSAVAAVGGYLGAVAAGSMFAPAAGAIAAELFPTEVRAAVAGWSVSAGVLGAVVGLLSFGALADAHGEFGTAALLLFLPAAAVAALVLLLPETKGRELEDWAEG